MTNLQYTFGIVFKSLEVFGDILSRTAVDGTVIDLNEAMIRVTFDTILESAFGINYNTQTDTHAISEGPLSDGLLYLHENELRLMEGFRRTVNPFRKYFFWLSEMPRFNTAASRLKTILNGIIKNYEDTHPEGCENDMSIMGHLMRHNYRDPRQRIADMNTFIVAGHETTSHSLTMMFVCICKNPEVKRKLQAELDGAIDKEAMNDKAKFPSISVLRSLPYLSMCINEAMRLFPTVGAGSKRCTLADIDYEGMHIPRGSVCVLHYFSMFRPHWLEKAHEFIPERWEEDAPHRDDLRSLLMPFATGGRNCIGQNLAKVELVMIAAYVLRFFDFELMGEPDYMIFLTMKATNVRVRVTQRTSLPPSK